MKQKEERQLPTFAEELNKLFGDGSGPTREALGPDAVGYPTSLNQIKAEVIFYERYKSICRKHEASCTKSAFKRLYSEFFKEGAIKW